MSQWLPSLWISYGEPALGALHYDSALTSDTRENLSTSNFVWWMRWVAINLSKPLCQLVHHWLHCTQGGMTYNGGLSSLAGLVVFLFFFTTPTILLATINELRVSLFNYTKIHVSD